MVEPVKTHEQHLHGLLAMWEVCFSRHTAGQATWEGLDVERSGRENWDATSTIR